MGVVSGLFGSQRKPPHQSLLMGWSMLFQNISFVLQKQMFAAP